MNSELREHWQVEKIWRNLQRVRSSCCPQRRQIQLSLKPLIGKAVSHVIPGKDGDPSLESITRLGR